MQLAPGAWLKVTTGKYLTYLWILQHRSGIAFRVDGLHYKISEQLPCRSAEWSFSPFFSAKGVVKFWWKCPCYVFQGLGVRTKISPEIHAKNGVKNGRFHANFTLLGRGADKIRTCKNSRINRVWRTFQCYYLSRLHFLNSCFYPKHGSTFFFSERRRQDDESWRLSVLLTWPGTLMLTTAKRPSSDFERPQSNVQSACSVQKQC